MTEHARRLTRRHALTGAATVGVGLPLLAACGSSDDTASDPTPARSASSPAAPAKGSSSAAAGAFAQTADIPVGGGVIYPDANLVITQPTAGTFKGFSATCTHQGCLVSKIEGDTIDCTCHGSEYSIVDGSVVQGPAPSPLPAVQLKASGGGITPES